MVIRERVPPDWAVRDVPGSWEKLSEWSIKARYPGDWAPPTSADAAAAIDLAAALLQSVLDDLQRRGLMLADG